MLWVVPFKVILGDPIVVDPNGSKFALLSDCPGGSSSGVGFRSTLRGLTSGSLPVRSGGPLAPCILLGITSSGWLPVVEQLGFYVVGILVVSDIGLSYVRRCVPVGCRILSTSDWGGLGALPFGALPGTVAFLDCRFTGSVACLLESVDVREAYSCRGIRRAVPGWSTSTCSVLHSAVGGVTTTVVGVTRLRLGARGVAARPLPFVVGRDASTILSETTYCQRFRSRPVDRVLVPLRVEEGVSGRIRFFHGGGLLPPRPSTSTWVLAPHVRSPAGRWGLRPLTFEEILLAFDFNLAQCRLFSSLSDAERHGLRSSFLPLRCLLYGCRALGLDGVWGDGGGGFSSGFSSGPPSGPSLPSPSLEVITQKKRVTQAHASKSGA